MGEEETCTRRPGFALMSEQIQGGRRSYLPPDTQSCQLPLCLRIFEVRTERCAEIGADLDVSRSLAAHRVLHLNPRVE